jgi:Fic family protein
MFMPTYEKTYFLMGCLEKIAAQRARLTAVRSEEALLADLERAMFDRSVHSSTKIEGNRLTLTQVSALHNGAPCDAEKEQKTEVVNALAAMRWVIAGRKTPFTEKGLLRLHETLTKGLLARERVGAYRTIQNYIGDGRGRVIETPPPPHEVAKRMRALFSWLDAHPYEHPLVRSAVFHHEFVTIHPFIDGNGRTARAASQWLLYAGGFEPWAALGLDEFYANDRARYYEMIRETRAMDGDMTQWVEYTAEGLVYATERAAAQKRLVIEQTREPWTGRQHDLVSLLKKHGPLGSAELCARLDVNRARVHELVAPLLAAGVVEKIGKARSTRYHHVIS